MKTPFLIAPCSTPTPRRAFQGRAQKITCYQDEAFKALLGRVMGGLQDVFQTKNEVLILPGGEAGALEGAVVNFFSPQDKVLFGIMGESGNRWAQIAERFGLQVLRLGSERGEVITAPDVELLLRSEAGKDIKGVFITHNEISTGVVADIERLGKVCQKHHLLFLVDALNSLGVVDLKTDEWGVDVVVASPKNLIAPDPYLSLFSVNDKAWKYNAKARCPRYYWDLAQTRKYFHHPTPESPCIPVSFLFGLDETVQTIKKEGLENIFSRRQKLSQMLRRGIEALGLELLVKDEYIASPSVTAIKVQEEVEAEQITSFLKEEGITTIGGETKLQGKIILIEHSDCFCAFDIANIIATLGRALKAQGVVVDLAKSLTRVWEVYDNE